MTLLSPYISIKVDRNEFPDGPPDNLKINRQDWDSLIRAGCNELRIEGYREAPRVHVVFKMQSLGVGSHSPALELTVYADGSISAAFLSFAEHATKIDNPGQCVRPAVWQAIRSWAQSLNRGANDTQPMVSPTHNALSASTFNRDERDLAEWADNMLDTEKTD